MDKQKELNAYEQMAVVCARWFSCGTCPYNPEANKESICPNFDKKLVYAMGKGYRKIHENAVVLTREEHQKYLAFKIIEPQIRGCLDREQIYQRTIENLKATIKIKDEHLHVRLTEQTRKETVEKIADWLDNEKGYCGLGYLIKREFLKEITGVENGQ